MQQSVPRANSLMWINERPNFVFVRGEGSWLTDDHGKRSLDFVQGSRDLVTGLGR